MKLIGEPVRGAGVLGDTATHAPHRSKSRVLEATTTSQIGAPSARGDILGINAYAERMKRGEVLGVTTQGTTAGATVSVDDAAVQGCAQRLGEDSSRSRGGLAAGLVARHMQK